MSGETFVALLAQNLGCIRRLVQARLRRSGEAEDVMQEILLRAFTRRNQLRVQAKFRSWLWSIAMNEIRGYFRRDPGCVSLDDLENFDARDPAASPLASFEEIETRDWLRGCIAELPERDQSAIRLRDFDGKSLREAAAVLQSSESAMKSTHFRARKRLAHIIRASAGPSGRIPIGRAA